MKLSISWVNVSGGLGAAADGVVAVVVELSSVAKDELYYSLECSASLVDPRTCLQLMRTLLTTANHFYVIYMRANNKKSSVERRDKLQQLKIAVKGG